MTSDIAVRILSLPWRPLIDLSERRWVWLQGLDPQQALRGELSAAGVHHSAISALYPTSAADIVRQLEPHLSEIGFTHLTGPAATASLVSVGQVALAQLEDDALRRFEQATDVGYDCWEPFRQQIRERLPEQEFRDAELVSRWLAIATWHSITLMSALDALPQGAAGDLARRSISEYFLLTSEQLLGQTWAAEGLMLQSIDAPLHL